MFQPPLRNAVDGVGRHLKLHLAGKHATVAQSLGAVEDRRQDRPREFGAAVESIVTVAGCALRSPSIAVKPKRTACDGDSTPLAMIVWQLLAHACALVASTRHECEVHHRKFWCRSRRGVPRAIVSPAGQYESPPTPALIRQPPGDFTGNRVDRSRRSTVAALPKSQSRASALPRFPRVERDTSVRPARRIGNRHCRCSLDAGRGVSKLASVVRDWTVAPSCRDASASLPWAMGVSDPRRDGERGRGAQQRRMPCGRGACGWFRGGGTSVFAKLTAPGARTPRLAAIRHS